MVQVGQEMQRILIFAIRVYKLVLSPFLGNNCRFHPGCANYAMEAIRLGACNFLQKNPFDLAEIANAVEKALEIREMYKLRLNPQRVTDTGSQTDRLRFVVSLDAGGDRYLHEDLRFS